MSYLRFHIKPFVVVAVVVIASVLGSQGVFGQSTFKVARGDTHKVTTTDQKMLVDEWIMEDNSTVIIAQGVTNWTIHAVKASFGNNTKIIGRGRNGSRGESSQQHGRNGGECKDGGDGQNGAHGTPGGNGVNVSITMGLVKVDGLLIDVRGGDGGNGGNGSNGGKGGRASCGRVCSGQEGGTGGKGGDAGHGGSGGKVKIDYWIAGRTPITFSNSSDRGLRADTAGGKPGQPGKRGNGGQGGDGRRCPPFNSIRRGSGSPGHNGSQGTVGQPGKPGTVTFSVLPSPSL